MKRRVRAALATLCLAATFVVGPAPTAHAARCDEIDRPVCEAAGGVCFLLYKLHINGEEGCLD